ncbi:hypothetical protein MTR_7g053440 [Medicago truncatula]|uniref:Uncharacterized protein n=1 Tax=Medicago truncatula TaxID=3880 RepID=A0A072TYH2_MEDTR|nr:hypothetical protein MTR_7g053440 [Medicago truncatula]
MRAGSGPVPGMLLGKTESHRNERVPEAVQSAILKAVWGVTNRAVKTGGLARVGPALTGFGLYRAGPKSPV